MPARQVTTIRRTRGAKVTPIDPRLRAAAKRAKAASKGTRTRQKATDGQIAALLLEGHTHLRIAEALGINRCTVTQRVNRPEFRAMMAEVEAELLGAAKRKALAGADIGIDVLVRAAQGEAQIVYDESGEVVHVHVVPWASRVRAGMALAELTVGKRLEVEHSGDLVVATAQQRLMERLSLVRERLEQAGHQIIEVSATEAKPKRSRKAK